jgi:hypothetical protein
MDRSSTYENKVHNNKRCEIFMNNVIIEETYEDNPNVQIETNKNPKKLMRNHENKI